MRASQLLPTFRSAFLLHFGTRKLSLQECVRTYTGFLSPLLLLSTQQPAFLVKLADTSSKLFLTTLLLLLLLCVYTYYNVLGAPALVG